MPAAYKKVFTDLDFSMTINPVTGDVTKVVNENSVKRGIRNILLTSMYERLMQPELGSSLKDVLFEPIDDITTARIERDVRSAIESWEDRAEVIQVFADPDPDYNGYRVSVTFRPLNAVVDEQVEVFLTRER